MEIEKSRKKDLLTLFEYSPDEIRWMLDSAAAHKRDRAANLTRRDGIMAGKTAVLIFEKPSLRTRISFETAVHELGGHVINLPPDSVGMGKRETVEDVARNLERMVHLIVARTFAHDTVMRLAGAASVPVINALTDWSHPCQALAFGLTLREHCPGANKNVVFVGDGNNVCNSIMVLCAKLGHSFTVAAPVGYEPNPELVDKCVAQCAMSGGKITVTNDIRAAVSEADIIYTDVWASMGQEAETEKRRVAFADFQVNEYLMSLAPKGALVTHCLPAHRDEEITSGVLDSPACVAYDEAENRLHAQKAVITYLFSENL